MNRERDVAIDRDKVRPEARKLDGTGLRVWLDRAIDIRLSRWNCRTIGETLITRSRSATRPCFSSACIFFFLEAVRYVAGKAVESARAVLALFEAHRAQVRELGRPAG